MDLRYKQKPRQRHLLSGTTFRLISLLCMQHAYFFLVPDQRDCLGRSCFCSLPCLAAVEPWLIRAVQPLFPPGQLQPASLYKNVVGSIILAVRLGSDLPLFLFHLLLAQHAVRRSPAAESSPRSPTYIVLHKITEGSGHRME
ncbi:hypothetical protein IF2G_03399 [Cordyceps javanica]|nr:hypothetical protein IF2G_03399 [Cordyceps javanica]